MTTSNVMSLPIDIPWKRLGTSSDMMDMEAGDRKFPAKWQSSLAIFYYEPPEEEQKFEDRIITYLKVSCTITGLQSGKGHVVQMPPARLRQKEWAQSKAFHNYNQAIMAYYPCYGALLQVSVFPKPEQEPLSRYPIIVDFEPKKREMYESATEAKQFMSQSRSGINVKKGTTTTETQEDNWNLSGSLSASIGFLSAGFGASGGRKSSTSTETVDQLTADYSREKRENYSYTTNLTHMYHLLNAYHLGTNRAMFLVQPRPHIVDSEYTFVNGPRRLEGIQEFFLVMERPKDVPAFCVEAVLETAHLETKKQWEPRVIPESALYTGDNLSKTSKALGISPTGVGKWLEQITNGVWTPIDPLLAALLPMLKMIGYEPLVDDEVKTICLRRGWNNLLLDERQKLLEGFKKGDFHKHASGLGGFLAHMSPQKWILEDQAYLWGLATAVLGRNPDVNVEDARIVYERAHHHTGTLFLTGRSTFNCINQEIYAPKLPDSVIHEKRISVPPILDDVSADNAARAASANLVSDTISRAMIESLSSPDRLPYGEVSLREALFIQEPLRQALAEMPDDNPYNVSILEIEDLDSELREQLVEVFGVEKRKDALRIDPYQLRTALGLSRVETRRLHSQLIGRGPELQVRPGAILVPNVEGTLLDEARELLAGARLTISEEIAYKDAVEARDTVLNQHPNAGTAIDREKVVSLVVSSGPVEVPDVVGSHADEATRRLEELSLLTEPSFAVSDEQPEGHVLETTPPAHTPVPRNSQVVLLVATKPETKSREEQSRTRK